LQRRENGGALLRDTALSGEDRHKFSVMKVPRQCPLALLLRFFEEKARFSEVEKVER
jgi:hypothetical protein